MFQTVQDFNEILRTVDQNINSCGVIIMLKLERIPTRLGMSLDKAIDEERSTYRALSNWTPSDGSRLAVPSVSHLILADLGDVWLNTKNVPQHIPSLSQSVAILCKAIEGKL